MRHYQLYRFLLALTPSAARHSTGAEMKESDARAVAHLMQKYRVYGAQVAIWQGEQVKTLCYGKMRSSMDVNADTVFRAASVSKMVTAMVCLRLANAGKLDLDADIGKVLGFPVRNPAFPDSGITLRQLLSHTSSIVDGEAFWRGAREKTPLPQVLPGCFAAQKPGTVFQYSNCGFGIIGSVLEAATGKNLDDLFDEVLFEQARVKAAFFPQNSDYYAGRLADGRRVLPPRLEYDGQKKACAAPDTSCAPMTHYALAHGGLCLSALSLSRLGRLASQAEFAPLRQEVVPFGARDPHISQGLGMFIIRDRDICPSVLYGHQGLAYGAVNGVFFRPDTQSGVAFLSSGVSEARRYVLADINRALIRSFLMD